MSVLATRMWQLRQPMAVINILLQHHRQHNTLPIFRLTQIGH